jgi:hypothetical protein
MALEFNAASAGTADSNEVIAEYVIERALGCGAVGAATGQSRRPRTADGAAYPAGEDRGVGDMQLTLTRRGLLDGHPG